MKKNTVKLFVLAFALAGGISAYAQTEEQKKWITRDYDHAALTKLSEELSIKAKQDRDEALAVAAVKGWPVKYKTEEGNTVELIALQPNGQPLYYTTYNAGAAYTSGITSLNTGGSLGLNINGEGMKVAMWDEESPRATHNTFSGGFGSRLQVADAALVQTTHPTHVMGTMIGNGGVGSSSPNLNAKGMAPLATGDTYNWINDYAEMAAAAESALLVSNHSYGNRANLLQPWQFGAYGGQAQQFDEIAFDAKYYLIVQAAGNDRGSVYNASKGGYDLINGTKTAKNAITVAAVNGLTPSAPYTGPESVVMSSFSSWGPTDDNRIKPDISAKGVGVFSSIDESNSSYGAQNGTSMASPVVAGGAILLQQLYSQQNDGIFMRSATVRGLICHTAKEAGPSNGPDPMFGWGLFDAEKAAQTILADGATSLIEERQLAQGQTYTTNIVATGSEPVKVSITWTDPFGPGNSGTTDSTLKRLVNDLDVRVTKDNTTYLPWRLASSHTAPAIKADNSVDNIERIDIDNASGTYTVTVSHKGNISSGPQQYTLIVTGGDQVLSTANNELNLFNVWPNPANTVVNFGFETGTDADVSFYDVQGREVLSSKLSGSSPNVNVEGLSAGIYVVKVVQDGKQQSKKLIINR